jgi:hypothetical protein
MRIRTSLLGLSLFTLFLTGCQTIDYQFKQSDKYSAPDVQSRHIKRAAILGFENTPQLQQSLALAFLDRGVQVVERNKVIDLVREQQLIDKKFADLSGKEQAMRLGRLLDADILVLGEATDFNLAYSYQQKHTVLKAALSPLMIYSIVLIPVWVKWVAGDSNAYYTAMKTANDTGQVTEVRRYKVQSYADIGATWRALDASTGEIIGVGNRYSGFSKRVKKDNIMEMSRLVIVQNFCKEIVTDCLGQ